MHAVSAVALAATTLALAACNKGDQVTVRTVNLHAPASCPVPARTTGIYTATGDYPLDPNATPPLLFLDQVGTELGGIPADVRSLALQAQATSDLSQWSGVTLVGPTGDVDVLVLPRAEACPLSANVGFVSGAPGAGGQLGADMIAGAADAHTMIVLGSDKLPATFRVDLDTGKIAKLAMGVVTPRMRAPFVATGGGGALVPGGLSVSTPVPLQNAEVYDPALGDFDGTIPLATPRADHAAVLLADGDVLLVGGQSVGKLVPELEVIHLVTHTTELLPVPLSEPRTRPVALRLADGTILVAGGFRADGKPSTTLEFFSPDGTHKARADETLAQMRSRDAVVALDGGGALVVVVPEASDGPSFQNAWNITPDGGLTAVPSVGAITDAKLFPGADGHPVLWAGDRWLSFDPWSTTQTWTAIDANSGVAGPSNDSPIVSPDPGLLAWVAQDGSVMLRRLSTRNLFATDAQPYLATSKDHMVPDRWSPTMTFDTSLSLPASTGAFVADARFLDATIDVDVPSDGVPQIVLRGESGAEVVVGGASCPFLAPPLPAHLHVERRGAGVTYRFGTTGNSAAIACAGVPIGPGERIAVGVRAGSGAARAGSLRITR